MKTSSPELRHLFLNEFTKSLIVAAAPKGVVILPPRPPQRAPSFGKPVPLMQRSQQIPPISSPMIASPKTKIAPGVLPIPQDRRLPPVPQASRAIPGYPDLGKINVLLTDPRVQEIQCPGYGKDIMVKKDGSLQNTKINLTKEELDSLIQKFSEATRIPLVRGMFKAAIGDIIMTAFVSDFVDTRFSIEKRLPTQPLRY